MRSTHGASACCRLLMRRGKVQDIISLEGPVERVDGRLVVRIPLNVGGDRLAPLATGIGEVVGEHLGVEIRRWLADKLQVGEGSWVVVDNRDGRFTITSNARYDTSSTIVTSNTQTETPSPRLVALARFWLIILGCLWCALGLVVVIDAGGEFMWLWLALIAVGVLHLVAARYARDRIAVLFALFGP